MLVAEKLAVIVWEPEPTAFGFTVTWQVDTPGVVVEVKLHGPVMVSALAAPPESEVTCTVPEGKELVPAASSVTVTVTVLDAPTATEVGFRLTVVVVCRVLMLKPLLVAGVKPELVAVSL